MCAGAPISSDGSAGVTCAEVLPRCSGPARPGPARCMSPLHHPVSCHLSIKPCSKLPHVHTSMQYCSCIVVPIWAAVCRTAVAASSLAWIFSVSLWGNNIITNVRCKLWNAFIYFILFTVFNSSESRTYNSGLNPYVRYLLSASLFCYFTVGVLRDSNSKFR